MTDQFTAEDALESTGTQYAIILDCDTIRAICAEHDASYWDYMHDDHGARDKADAGVLLAWLGY